MNRKNINLLIAIFLLSAGLSGCKGRVPDELDGIISSMILSIRNTSDVDYQNKKSKDIFYILKNKRCGQMKRETVEKIVTLLDVRHDGVRYWTARTLKRIGECARIAVPTLRRILPQADCWPGGLTSAHVIREVLAKLDNSKIPDTICTAYGEGHAAG